VFFHYSLLLGWTYKSLSLSRTLLETDRLTITGRYVDSRSGFHSVVLILGLLIAMNLGSSLFFVNPALGGNLTWSSTAQITQLSPFSRELAWKAMPFGMALIFDSNVLLILPEAIPAERHCWRIASLLIFYFSALFCSSCVFLQQHSLSL